MFLSQHERKVLDVVKARTPVGISGGFAVDLSQSEQRLRAGPWLPTLARSSKLFSVSQMKCFTAAEIDAAMGWPSLGSIFPSMAPYADAIGFGDAYSCDTEHSRALLAGNGMSLPQVMAWSLYIMSNCARRCHVERLEMPLLSGADIRDMYKCMQGMQSQSSCPKTETLDDDDDDDTTLESPVQPPAGASSVHF